MLNAGTKPTSWTSTLSGLSKEIYDQRIAEGIIPSESKLSTTVGDQTYSESDSERSNRVFKAKKDAWVVANATITEIVSNAEVNDISSVINTSLGQSLTVPQDGGTSLKSTFATALSTNNPLQKGSIS